MEPKVYNAIAGSNKKYSFKDIINDVFDKSLYKTRPFPPLVTLSFTTAAQAIINTVKTFNEVRSTPGDTVFGFISNLANQLGLYLFCQPGTSNIKLQSFYILALDASSNFGFDGENQGEFDIITPYYLYSVKGENNTGYGNIISRTITSDLVGYYTRIKIAGNASQEEAQASRSASGQLYWGTKNNLHKTIRSTKAQGDLPAAQGYLNKFKYHVINDGDYNTWAYASNNMIYNLTLQQQKTALDARYTVIGNTFNRVPYFIGRTVTVEDTGSAIGDNIREYFIYSVELSGDKNSGQTSTLGMLDRKATLDFVEAK